MVPMAKNSSTWKCVKFGEVIDVVTEYWDRDPNVPERFVAGEHIDERDLRVRRWGMTTDQLVPPTFNRRFRAGDVLFHSRNINKLAWPDFDGITGEKLFVLRPLDRYRLIPGFLPFLLQTPGFHEYVSQRWAGSTNKFLNKSPLLQYEFVLPSLEEQQRQVELLTSLRANVDAARESSYYAEQVVASLRERNLGRKSLKRRLGDLIVGIETGSSHSGSDQPPKLGERGVLRVSSVGRGGFLPGESKALLDPALFDSTRNVRAGDLLITRANTAELVGMSCLVNVPYDNLMLSDKILRIIPSRETTAPFLLEALWTNSVRGQLRSMATGTGAAMKNISQEKLRNIELPFDSLEHQAETILAIGKAKSAHSAAILRTEQARNLYSHGLNIIARSE